MVHGPHGALGAFQCSLQDDSKIPNEFQQHCNVSSSKKCLNPLTQTSLQRYRLFLFGDQLYFVPQTRFLNNDVRKRAMVWRYCRVMTFFFLNIHLAASYITQTVIQKSGDLQIENTIRPSARLPTCNVASRSP